MTDQEKIDDLWKKLDGFHQENANLKGTCAQLEQTLAQKEHQISQLRATEAQLIGEIHRLGKEVNSARGAAANAVREYIEATKNA